MATSLREAVQAGIEASSEKEDSLYADHDPIRGWSVTFAEDRRGRGTIVHVDRSNVDEIITLIRQEFEIDPIVPPRQRYLEVRDGSASIHDAETKECLQAFVWPVNGGHVSEIMGDGDNQWLRQVCYRGSSNTMMLDDKHEAAKELGNLYGIKDVRF